MNPSGFLDINNLTSWQLELMRGTRRPQNDDEIKWFEKHDMDILIDSQKPQEGGRREREVFVAPTHAAMSAPKD